SLPVEPTHLNLARRHERLNDATRGRRVRGWRRSAIIRGTATRSRRTRRDETADAGGDAGDVAARRRCTAYAVITPARISHSPTRPTQVLSRSLTKFPP